MLPNYRLADLSPTWAMWQASTKDYYMGGDQLAQSVLYFTMLYYRMWMPAMALAAFEVAYFGPMSIGGPLAGITGALTLL